MRDDHITRRDFLHYGGVSGALVGVDNLLPRWRQHLTDTQRPESQVLDGSSGPIEITIAETDVNIDGRRGRAVTMNGTVPGPLLRFHEGDEAIIHVTNALDEDTSIHWHGLILTGGPRTKR